MSYTDVQKILDDSDKEITKKYNKYISYFKLMEELATILKNKRLNNGYLNLDIPESKIELNQDGVAVNVHKYESYFANEIVIQAIIKGWDIVILDLKRSYGLYKAFTDYCYEVDDIIDKLHSVEAEMKNRMETLQPELDKNPQTLAVDIGYKPMLVVIEEYISLQSSLDKKQKEELERVVKNLSVLARQSNIHLMIVLQSAGTENINSTRRSNLTKVLLGNAQSNILNATFGSGVDIPNVNSKLNKGEGMIGLDRITMLRVPEIVDIDNFKDVFYCVAEGNTQ